MEHVKKQAQKTEEEIQEEEELNAKPIDETQAMRDFLRAQNAKSAPLTRAPIPSRVPTQPHSGGVVPSKKIPASEILYHVILFGFAAYGVYTAGFQTKNLISAFFQKVSDE